jgi:alkyldihydroxyacetonephosphate synthase
METNRGAPTPPIAFAGDASGVADRLRPARVEIGGELREQLASTGADVSTAASEIGEASRDWWPLAMIWALDNQVATRASVIVRPHSAAEVAAVLRICNAARVPVTAAAGRSGVCGASVPVFGGVLLDLTALEGIIDVDHTSMLVDVLPGTFGDVFEDALRDDHGVTCGHWPQSMALSTVGGWLACRGAGQLSTRYGKIEDIVVGLDVVLADGTLVTTGGAPRAAVGPDLTQLFVGSEACIPCRRLRSAPRTRSRRSPPGSTRCAGSSSAARRPQCCGSTTRSKPTAATRPATPTFCSPWTRATRIWSTRPVASSTRNVRRPK